MMLMNELVGVKRYLHNDTSYFMNLRYQNLDVHIKV